MLLAINTTLQLLNLRALMLDLAVTGTEKEVSAYIVPLADAHYGSRVAECDQRLKFISGFTGSAGSAVIMQNLALLWTDGRYFTQANDELDGNWQLMRDGLPETPSPGDFLNRNLSAGSLVGVDPTLYSKADWNKLETELKIGGHQLVPVDINLVDRVWTNRPNCPVGPLITLELNFTGMTTADKLIDVRRTMTEQNTSAVVLSELDEIAWLLNLRGSDLSSASVFISYLTILPDKFQLFINPAKITEPSIRTGIEMNGGEIFNYEEVGQKLSEIIASTTGKIWFSNKCNYALVQRAPENRQIVNLTPLAMLKAVKNPVEAEGMKTALRKDAATIVRFFSWLETALINGENVTELSASARLLEMRRQNENFLTTSFTTISAFGSNGAIIHYRPTEATNKQITTEGMYLLDSGAIYKEGTTDITRTLHFGTPTDYQRDCYTRVLKGQIAIVTSNFPSKTRASRLDSFARRSLWSVGLDYNHGTGHGIGHALNVHEGPSYIRNYYMPDDQGYRANMFTSNEPGYYEEGEFGIRLENIIQVVNVTLENNFQNRDFLGFADLTFVPYQQKLIKTELLTTSEIEYLNRYQQQVRDIVGEYIKMADPTDPAYGWLAKETHPISVAGKASN